MERRVVITGLGLVTPLGIGVEETWSALLEGRSGIGEITRFDTTEFTTKIAGQVNGFNAEDFLPKKDAKRTRTHHLLLPSPQPGMALESDSGLKINRKKRPTGSAC